MRKALVFALMVTLGISLALYASITPQRSCEFNKAAIEAYDAIDRFQTHCHDQQAFMREVEAENALTALDKVTHTGIEGNVQHVLFTYFLAVKRYQFDLMNIRHYTKAQRDKISISKQSWEAMSAAQSMYLAWNPS